MTTAMGRRRRRNGLGLVAAIGMMSAAALALVAVPRVGAHLGIPQPERAVERLSLPIAPSAVLHILNASGDITVTASDGDRAVLTITREAVGAGNAILSWIGRGPAVGAQSFRPRVREKASGIEVSTLADTRTDASYRIEVKLPRGRGLAATNGNGPITIAGIDGDVTAVSDNGDVHCEDISGRVEANVRNGHVLCRYVSGAVYVKAVNGSVSIEHGNAPGAQPVCVWTTNGQIRFSATAPSVNLVAETENGRIVTAVEPAAGARRTLRTLDARSETDGGEVELHAVNGNIYVDAF